MGWGAMHTSLQSCVIGVASCPKSVQSVGGTCLFPKPRRSICTAFTSCRLASTLGARPNTSREARLNTLGHSNTLAQRRRCRVAPSTTVRDACSWLQQLRGATLTDALLPRCVFRRWKLRRAVLRPGIRRIHLHRHPVHHAGFRLRRHPLYLRRRRPAIHDDDVGKRRSDALRASLTLPDVFR